MQALVKEFLSESLRQEENSVSIYSFQEKAFNCIKIQREYCVKFKACAVFNSFLRAFKVYLLREANNKKYAIQVEKFWTSFLLNSSMSLITHRECAHSDVGDDDSEEFLKSFRLVKDETPDNESKLKEDEEDLLDLM